ncbi:hypothetical protein ABE41_001655 [Fictibacillus arsenicus]|uniref:Uncharacterized protein n=1 Tax=Fictibacillus arsenicus TaxID=255247 RepID=A0A1B1YZV5_9BACL|nr:hypothetical protein [Fictibacillus arsenicus]ANX10718.1 hypothetical protein ABE41_001655 [Fictibacillus arsenicus]
MSLAEVTTWNITKKQYRYKLKSYFGVFSSLVAIQLLAILFSLNGTGMSGGSSGTFSYDVNYYTGDIIQVLVMIWAFITAIIITTKAYRYDDYSFVTNRLISHYSNILFLISASILAGIMVFFSGHLFRLITIFLKNADSIMVSELTLLDTLKVITASILYIFLCASIGYFVGILIQLNRLFSFLLPVLFVGALFVDGLNNDPTLFPSIIFFFGSEKFLLLLILKIILASALFYMLAISFSNRMEVRP